MAFGVPPERIFKTLVVAVDGALAVGVVPVRRQLDLKALASAVEFATMFCSAGRRGLELELAPADLIRAAGATVAAIAA